MLINTISVWVNADSSVEEKYLELIEKNLIETQELSNIITVYTILDIMETLGKFDNEKYCCCNATYTDHKIDCFLNLRYDPIVNFVSHLIRETPKELECNISIILFIILNHPSHCLLIAMIKLIIEIVKTAEGTSIITLENFNVYISICNISSEFEADIKVLCLNLGQLLAAKNYNQNDVEQGIYIILSRYLTVKEDDSKAAIMKKKSIEKICDYLVEWMINSKKYCHGKSKISKQLLLSWIINLTRNSNYWHMAAKFFWNLDTCIFQRNDGCLIFEYKGLADWLLDIEASVYLQSISINEYTKLAKLHSTLIMKSFKYGSKGKEFFVRHEMYAKINKENVKKIMNLAYVINQFLAQLNDNKMIPVVTLVYELTSLMRQFESEKNAEISTIISLNSLFGLPFAHVSEVTNNFLKLVSNFCKNFFDKISLTSITDCERKKTFYTQPNDFMNALVAITKPYTEDIDISCYICNLFYIAIQYSELVDNLNEAFESFITFYLILLEFSKIRRSEEALVRIEKYIRCLFSSLILKTEIESNSLSTLLANSIKKFKDAALAPNSASHDLYEIIFKVNGKSVLPIFEDLANPKFDQSLLNSLKASFTDSEAHNAPFKIIETSTSIVNENYLPEQMFQERIARKPSECLNNYKEAVFHYLVIMDDYRRKCEHKWKKMLKSLKQWQGFWRDRNLFDVQAGIDSLPYKASPHCFYNNIRCLTSLLTYTSKYLNSPKLKRNIKEFGRSKQYNRLLANAVPMNINYEKYSISAVDLDKTELHIEKNMQVAIKILTSLKNETALSELSTKNDSLTTFDCELFKVTFVIPGKVMLTIENGNIFVKFYIWRNPNQPKDERLFLTYSHTKDRKFSKKWCLQGLTRIYKKDMIDSKKGVELCLEEGRTILFNFVHEGAAEQFCNLIVKYREKIYKEKTVVVSNGMKSPEKAIASQDWLAHTISTFDYLLILNALANRSFNNCSQYPVMPWLIIAYEKYAKFNEPESYRDLSKPVGMIGNEKRAKKFRERLNQDDAFSIGRFNYGTHYSNPNAVVQFMMRLQPYFEAYYEFFSGLDSPNRMFYSIKGTFFSVCNDSNDVRELIPEFYIFPEIFKNSLSKSFGFRDEEVDNKVVSVTPVNDVILPEWCNNDSYSFVIVQRILLEDIKVGEKMNHWIDLIFGYQQRGKEAELACNVFPPLTTEPKKLLAKVSGEGKEQLLIQAFHWGQTPQQLFDKPHKERSKKLEKGRIRFFCDETAVIRLYTIKAMSQKDVVILRKSLMLKSTQSIRFDLHKDENEILGKIINIKIISDDISYIKFLMITENGMILESNIENSESSSCKLMSCVKFAEAKPFPKHIIVNNKYIIAERVANMPIIVIKCKTGQQIAQGGYYNGTIRVTSINNLANDFVVETNCAAINAMEINSKENFVVAGSIQGECVTFHIDNSYRWIPMKYIRDHSGKINHISISDRMQLFATASDDGSVNLYNTGVSPKLIRCFRHSNKLPITSVI